MLDGFWLPWCQRSTEHEVSSSSTASKEHKLFQWTNEYLFRERPPGRRFLLEPELQDEFDTYRSVGFKGEGNISLRGERKAYVWLYLPLSNTSSHYPLEPNRHEQLAPPGVSMGYKENIADNLSRYVRATHSAWTFLFILNKTLYIFCIRPCTSVIRDGMYRTNISSSVCFHLQLPRR